MNNEFATLKTYINQQGLLQPTPAFYIRRVTVAMALVAISVAILATVTNFWAQIANAVLLAFAFGQLGLFMHDVGHGQVVGARWHRLMAISLNVLLGWNVSWWIHKHNRHHAFPNQPGYDPDVDIQFIAFSKDQARKKKGWYRVFARYQHIFLIPLLSFELWSLRCAGISYLLRQRTTKAATDLFLMAAHLVLYTALLLFFLTPWHALAFAAIHTGLVGIYLGLIFAPNHKGMPMIKHTSAISYLQQQILTSRNVRGGWFVDFIYGGLNYQIEHHLFPSMPRNRLKHAAPIVRVFCKEINVPYLTVSVPESFRLIFSHLARVAKAVPSGSS